MPSETPEPTTATQSAEGSPPRVSPRRPLSALLDLFSSVRFGIWLLVVLFIYSSIGSAGIIYPEGWNIFSSENWAHDQIRQWRVFEMTEFEWFHWWPFDLLMILISANIVVTTLRRIPFRPVNYGVWMIHGGIIVLVVGSFIYFGLKIEGDTPVARRKVVAEFDAVQPDGSTRRESIELVVSPGQRIERGDGAARIALEVRSVDPAWELLTGDEKGKRVYSVTVMVERDGKRYLRQLLAGHPELTEDLVFTDDHTQPVKRAVKETGKPIFDESLAMRLDYQPQEWLYLRNDLRKSWALYIRPKGAAEWTERPIDGLPLYNDYISARDDVIQQGGDEVLPIDAIEVAVPAVSPEDPLKDVTFTVDGYLRYAIPRTRVADAGPLAPLNPIVLVKVRSDRGQEEAYRVVAFDAQKSRADGGLLRFVHLGAERELERFMRQPSLSIRIPGRNIEVREVIREVAASNPDAPFVEIQGSAPEGKAPYGYRVVNVQDGLPIGGTTVAVAIVELRTPKGLFRRWVFDDPRLTRDVRDPVAADAHGAPKIEDDTIDIAFDSGNGLAFVVVAHGPEEGRLRVVSAVTPTPSATEAKIGVPVPIGSGLSVEIDELFVRGRFETKPQVIPREQRQRDAMEAFAQARLVLPDGRREWIPFTQWVFDSEADALRRGRYEPRTVRLPNGREYEVLFSRQRLPLGTQVALEEFVLTAHMGGYTGETGSIRDYRSRLRFRDGESAPWSDTVDTSMNSPAQHGRLWYFQAQWDPPDARAEPGEVPSAGLNYTVLGVGNREGVHIQLAGCVIAVAGMIYAFYVKPVIKRRRREEVLAALSVERREADRTEEVPS
jgi:hypothetical protein